MNSEKISFILPCLNEQDSIGFCIKEIQRKIEDSNLNAEILIIDNNSTDNSAEIAIKNGATVIKCEEEGAGSATIKGINNATGKYAVIGDSDGQHNFYDIDEFLEKIKDYDLIKGNRFIGQSEKSSMNFIHNLFNKFLAFIFNLKYHTGINDINCGFSVIKIESIKKLELNSSGIEYLFEILVKSKKNGLRMLELPINVRKDKRTNDERKLNPFKDGLREIKFIHKVLKNRY